VAQGCGIHEPAVAHGCAVMSRKDGHDRIVAQGAMDGGAINEPKDGEGEPGISSIPLPSRLFNVKKLELVVF